MWSSRRSTWKSNHRSSQRGAEGDDGAEMQPNLLQVPLKNRLTVGTAQVHLESDPLPNRVAFGELNSNMTGEEEEEEARSNTVQIQPTLMRKKKLPTCRNLVYRFLIDSGREPPGSCLWRLSVIYQLLVSNLVIGLVLFAPEREDLIGLWDLTAVYIAEYFVLLVWMCEHGLRLWSCVESPSVRNPETPSRRGSSELLGLGDSKREVEAARIDAERVAEKLRGNFCLISVRPRFLYLLQPLMFVDTVALCMMCAEVSIESNWLRGVSVLRLMRLLSLFRIQEKAEHTSIVFMIFRRKKKELLTVFGLANFVAFTAACIVYWLEESSQGTQFTSMEASLWWAYTCMTTVGYGDIVPQTLSGRFVASMVALMGTGVIGLFGAIMSDGFHEMFSEELHEKLNAVEEMKGQVANVKAQEQELFRVVSGKILEPSVTDFDDRLPPPDTSGRSNESDVSEVKEQLEKHEAQLNRLQDQLGQSLKLLQAIANKQAKA